ncbi:hypothetical protein GIB67_012538 [Kingdonia uniflora]|uniref:Uncharacterized protein n=1 Tax=Kingdonia uniflora TaxID=39325 RepID=A0A7J7N5V2_9MAGN|nr:hypothetical protein GIB67_012538 [Kingdonia uniflora]
MKSDKEVNEQVDEENRTREGEANKGTLNAKNYTSRCTGLRLYKIFTALPEEENGTLRATCFAPLLLIDPITTMSTLVVKIFDRHLGDIKFQFGETIIQMKLIHVCQILGIRVSLIVNEFLFVNPEHMMNFKMRRFPKKKNTYGLNEIDNALKQTKLERHQENVFRLNLLKIILSFLLPNKGRNVWVNLKFPRIEESIHLFPKLQGWRMTSFKRRQIVMFKKFFTNPKLLVIAMKPSETDMQQGLVQEAMRNQIEVPTIGTAPAIGAPVVGAPAIGSSSSANEIGVVVVREVTSGKGLEVVKYLMVDDDVEVGRKVNFKAISSEYSGDLLENFYFFLYLCSFYLLYVKWKKGDEKGNYDKRDAVEKVKYEEEQPQVAEEEDS